MAVNTAIFLMLFAVALQASGRRIATRNKNDLKRQRPSLQGLIKVIDFSSKDKHIRKMHAHRIPCPMMASFYRKGWLNPDKYGRVESAEMYSCLRKSGASVMSSFFQASGIVSYKETDYEQLTRNRKVTFWMLWGIQKSNQKRYVNLFRMNPGDFGNSHQVQHGISTTIRDGRYDHMAKPVVFKTGAVLDTTGSAEVADDQQEYDRVRKLRQKRFDEWMGAEGVFDERGRMYAKGLGQLLVNMKQHGDRSGEFSFVPNSSPSDKQNIDKCHPNAVPAADLDGPQRKEALSEWQASLAWIGTVLGFGQNLTSGIGGEYITRDDLVSLFLDSELPKSWKRVDWGFKPSDINFFMEYDRELYPALKFPREVKNKEQYLRSPCLQGQPESARIGLHYLNTFKSLGMLTDAQDYPCSVNNDTPEPV